MKPVNPLRADMNDAKKMFDIGVKKVFTGAAPLMGARAMAAFTAHKVVHAVAAAAIGRQALSHLS